MIFSSLGCFKDFLFIIHCQQFDYDVSWCDFLYVYSAFGLWAYWICVYISNQILKIPGYCSFKYLCAPSCLLSFSGTPAAYFLDCLMLSQGHWGSVQFFNLFFFFLPVFRFVLFILPDLEIHLFFPSTVSDLLLSPCSNFFYLIIYFSCKISIQFLCMVPFIYWKCLFPHYTHVLF